MPAGDRLRAAKEAESERPTVAVPLHPVGTLLLSMSRPTDLNSHHRNTLDKIFQHPASHNVEWHDVLSLLTAIGSVARHRDNKVAVTVGSETRFFDIPEHKDVDVDSIVDLRRVLTDAGYGTPDG